MSTTLTCQRLTAVYRSSPHHLSFYLVRPVNLSRFQNCRTYATSTENLPRIAQPSVWHSIIPKAFRSPETSRVPAKPQRSKDWNPATFFICVFLLIGSNAIQMLTLKNEYSTFSRKADAKIKQLKDVLDRVQRGDNVDVEKVLGTGDEEQEQEWRDGKWLHALSLMVLRSSYPSISITQYCRSRPTVASQGPQTGGKWAAKRAGAGRRSRWC